MAHLLVSTIQYGAAGLVRAWCGATTVVVGIVFAFARVVPLIPLQLGLLLHRHFAQFLSRHALTLRITLFDTGWCPNAVFCLVVTTVHNSGGTAIDRPVHLVGFFLRKRLKSRGRVTDGRALHHGIASGIESDTGPGKSDALFVKIGCVQRHIRLDLGSSGSLLT
jgi:hypothetical protein